MAIIINNTIRFFSENLSAKKNLMIIKTVINPNVTYKKDPYIENHLVKVVLPSALLPRANV